MKIYISGNISSFGNSEQNVEEFYLVEDKLRKLGHKTVNPCKYESKSWAKNLARDILLIEKCDAIFMLKGWDKSEGAKLENGIANKLKKKILTDQDFWLKTI